MGTGPGDKAGAELTVVRVRCGAVRAEMLAAWAEGRGLDLAQWFEADRDAAVSDIYVPRGTRAEDLASAAGRWLRRNGADGGAAVEVAAIRNEDWAESWKAHFPVRRVSRRIVVKPSWESFTPRPGDCVVEIDPGMSFGTGLHPTTRACLRFIDNRARAGRCGACLDAGCGSGIVGIAAAKLGMHPVVAIDTDDAAVAIARDNCRRNGVSDRVDCRPGDARDLSGIGRYGAVVANILADVLVDAADSLAGAVDDAPGSRLILSGVLTGQYDRVAAAYAALGFAEDSTLTEGEWRSGSFRRPGRRAISRRRSRPRSP